MKAIDIDGELRELVASEEVLAYFDFVLPLGGAGDAEGLCKVSRPRERNSRSTYLSLFFIIDAHDEATRRAVDAHMSRADWSSCGAGAPGVDCVLAIPHRSAKAGLFLKEIDVYLDGSQPPTVAFVRDVLGPAISSTAGIHASDVTAWDEPPSTAGVTPSAAPAETLFGRLRRLVGGGQR